jgi:cyclohexanone monooxygenase
MAAKDERLVQPPSADAEDQTCTALQEKYREERAKRIRPDGVDQYVRAVGEFAHYLHDPYVKTPLVREPQTDEVDAVIVGGGFAGLLSGVCLRQAGVSNIRLIETGADFGGVWYWNRYPGCACDVDSYIYMPLLEELGYMPTEKYAKAGEIRAHASAIGRHFDLYRNALFQTRVTRIRWDESLARWMVSTDHGDELKARFVQVGVGTINHPKLPGIPGIDTFKGVSFHTSRWDYSYTGGNASGNLTGLKDKSVAVIGTGATAIQCVPHLGASAKRLYVVQRTPAIVDIRGNKPTDPAWVKTLQSGWQRRRMENFDGLLAGVVRGEDLVADQWTDIWEAPAHPQGNSSPPDPALMQKMDFEKLERIRARVDAIVKDPRTAEALKPYYNRFCKRPCFHDEYLPTFNRPNVTLIDTRGRGLDRITENALWFDGKSYEVDCIVYASGFEVGAFTHKGGGFELIGCNGVSIDQQWQSGARTLHGMYVRGFPNLFLIGNYRQGSPTINWPYMVGEQARHTADIVKRLLAEGVKRMEVKQAAQDRWHNTIKEKSVFSEDYVRACTPSYYNNEGKAIESSAFATVYGGGPLEYIEVLADWRDHGLHKDLELS